MSCIRASGLLVSERGRVPGKISPGKVKLQEILELTS